MSESFLHYIWQYQFYSKNQLLTTDGESLSILSIGEYNLDSGPDFKYGKVIINSLEWLGHIEIHVKASEWFSHKHHLDQAYDNVVLHVVWINNRPAKRSDGSLIPTVEIEHRVHPELVSRSERLFLNLSRIACEHSIGLVQDWVISQMINNAYDLRVNSKAQTIYQLYRSLDNSWNETAYQLLASNYGFQINSEPFKRLAELLPHKIIMKHASDLFQIEALLFGTAGLLDAGRTKEDAYYRNLKSEYQFLKKKYGFTRHVNSVEWKYMRMRPANFPLIRIAQFAVLLHNRPNLFSQFVNFNSRSELFKLIGRAPSEYWRNHFRFGVKSPVSLQGMGKASMNSILINTIVPMLFAYGKYMDRQDLIHKAIELISKTPPEKNNLVNRYQKVGIEPKNALQTQGLYSLFRTFCKPKRCLQCEIGVSVFKNNS